MSEHVTVYFFSPVTSEILRWISSDTNLGILLFSKYSEGAKSPLQTNSNLWICIQSHSVPGSSLGLRNLECSGRGLLCDFSFLFYRPLLSWSLTLQICCIRQEKIGKWWLPSKIPWWLWWSSLGCDVLSEAHLRIYGLCLDCSLLARRTALHGLASGILDPGRRPLDWEAGGQDNPSLPLFSGISLIHGKLITFACHMVGV